MRNTGFQRQRALCLALCAGVSFLLFPATALSQDEVDDQVVELDRVHVTGSRIKRVDIEGSTPVTVITREDIDNSGDSTVAELLRSSTFNSMGSLRDQSGQGNGFSGAAFVSLRGLGRQRTLILMDGRRLSAFPGGGGTGEVNLNVLPIDMVERIEILRDGASAIYGSDAIAGVINIISRKDINGVTLTVQVENPEPKGGSAQRYSVAGGISSDRGNVTFSIEHFRRDMIFDRDIPAFANAVEPGVDSITSYGFPGSIILISGPRAGASYPDPRCPSNVGDSELFPNSYRWDFTDFVAGSNSDGGSGSDRARCGYNFAADTVYIPKVERSSGYINGRFEVTPTTQFVTRALYSINESESRQAGTLVNAPLPFYAADNPNNPVYALINAGIDGLSEDDVGVALLLVRTVPNGTRESFQKFTQSSLFAGFEGTADWFGGMDWDIGFEYIRNITNSETRNFANKVEIQNSIDDGSLDYFNVQGLPHDEWLANTQNVLRAFNHTGTFQAESTIIQYDATASWDLFQLDNGPVPVVIGFQVYDLTWSQMNDIESTRGIIAGTSGGDTIERVGRDINAIYAEIVFPLLNNLELNLAVRYDDYSDFGGTTNPKASIGWRPLDNLLLRASYGTGFRAPDMQELWGNIYERLGGGFDYVGCANGVAPCSGFAYPVIVGGNPDLDAEKSDSWTVGGVWNATDNLSFELSYYNIQFTEQITKLTLEDMFRLERDGYDNTVNRNPDGTVDFVQLTSLNLSGVKTDGIDFIVNYSLNTANAGLFSFGLQASRVLSYEWEVTQDEGFIDRLNFNGNPKIRAIFRANWTLGNFQVGWLSNYISANGKADIERTDNSGKTAYNKSNTVHDLQLAYSLPWNAEIAVGARNVFDKDPPLNGAVYGWIPMDRSLYDAQGRITYLRYKQNF